MTNIITLLGEKYFQLIVKIFNLGAAGVKLFLTSNISEEYPVVNYQFWESVMSLVYHLVKLCFLGFDILATEGAAFLKKAGDLFDSAIRDFEQFKLSFLSKDLQKLKVHES